MKVSGLLLTFVLLASTVASASGMQRRGQNNPRFSLPFPLVEGWGRGGGGARRNLGIFSLEERRGCYGLKISPAKFAPYCFGTKILKGRSNNSLICFFKRNRPVICFGYEKAMVF